MAVGIIMYDSVVLAVMHKQSMSDVTTTIMNGEGQGLSCDSSSGINRFNQEMTVGSGYIWKNSMDIHQSTIITLMQVTGFNTVIRLDWVKPCSHGKQLQQTKF